VRSVSRSNAATTKPDAPGCWTSRENETTAASTRLASSGCPLSILVIKALGRRVILPARIEWLGCPNASVRSKDFPLGPDHGPNRAHPWNRAHQWDA
jgi:hypothetical protein